MVGLCRLCASLRKMDLLFTIKDDCSDLCEKLRRCCGLSIKMCDTLPKSICQECIDNLNSSYRFYIKVKEAQETLQSLYPTTSIREEGKTKNESLQPTLVPSASVYREQLKQEKPLMKPNLEKYANENEDIIEVSLKQISVENILVGENDSFPKTFERNVDTSQKVDINMSQVTKVPDDCEISYEILESVEENDSAENEKADYLDDVEFCDQDQQIINYKVILQQNNTHKTLSNENDLQPDEIIKHLNDISENELQLEIEYVEEDETATSMDIHQYLLDKNQTKMPSDSVYIKLNSWKMYKYLCFICDNIYQNFIQLKSHIEHDHKITQMDKLLYKCYDCKKVIPRYNFFLNHVRSKHHSNLKLRCDVCDLSCQNYEELSYHRSFNCVDAKNYAYTLPCTQCFKTFHNVFGLRNHCKLQHGASRTKEKYLCVKCNKEFQYKSCLKGHEQLHADTKKFSCIYCEKSFYNKISLEQHLYVHVDEKIYQCNICCKSYKTFQILDEHQKLHINEKPFKCQFCDKCFNKKVQKITHERRHTGAMPYSCSHCIKRFRHRSALHAHIKSHTGVKPYSCEYCVKTFADSSNRNKHVRRMHPNGEKVENTKK